MLSQIKVCREGLPDVAGACQLQRVASLIVNEEYASALVCMQVACAQSQGVRYFEHYMQ